MKIAVELVLNDFRALSRNDTTNRWAYAAALTEAENAMNFINNQYVYHFTNPVDVHIDAYFDTRPKKKVDRSGRSRTISQRVIDAPNLDDKIFTDILVKHKQRYGKGNNPIERNKWFIEDDTPKYLRRVSKQTHAAECNQVVITIEEVA